MRKKLLSIILSLAMVLTMIPMMGSVAFAAESEDNATYKISVWQPVVGQAVPQDFYSVSCASSAPAIALSDDTCLRAKFGSGSTPMRPGDKFSYDQEVLFHTSISATGGERFTGNETLSINGKPVPICFNEDMNVIYINQKGYDEAFSLGVLKRTSISDIYLTGYKPVKMGTTPAVLSVDETADPGHVYEGKGYYTDNVMHKNEASSFEDGKDYWMHIRLEAAYDYSFEDITSGNIHIVGYDMPAEGFDIFAANGSDSIYPSYIEISLPAQRAQKNVYEFTIPEPKEGELPGNVTLQANDDIICTGTTWYKSPDGWFNSPDTVKMKDRERFEAGYDYFVQPQYSWKDEELDSDSYTINVNGNTYNGEYYDFGHIYKNIDLKITVAEPKIGGTPAQTFSADIPISDQRCQWYFLPNAPSTDGFQPMKPTDKFALGCCYAFLPGFNYDKNFYNFNRIYVNSVDISEIGFMMFGPLHDFSKCVSNGDGTHKILCKDCGATQEGHDADACSGGTATCKARAVCTKCGEEYGSLAAHKGGTATCKAKAKCTVCGKEYGELAAHTYATKWSTNATNHWHACTVCGAKKDNAAHTDSDKNEKCDTCDYNMHSHSGTKVAQVDSTCTSYGVKAYYKCSCGKYYTDSACTKEITDLAAWKSGDGRIDKKPHTGGTATCKVKAKCSVCGEEYGSLAAHTYATKWSTNATNHWHACTVCGAETGELAAHKLATATVKKATMSVNGKTETKCEVCGKVTKTATVYAAKTVKLSKSKYAYSGKAITPAALVKNSKGTKLVKGTDYTVSMAKGRTKVGTYKITIKGKGKYSFTKELTLTIKPNPTPIVKVTPGKKSFTVKWTKKTVQVDGYEIQYSTSSGFKTGNKAATIKSNKTTSRVCKSLKAKKTYYVRVRTYKTVNGKKIYSVWSAKKSVKTK